MKRIFIVPSLLFCVLGGVWIDVGVLAVRVMDRWLELHK